MKSVAYFGLPARALALLLGALLVVATLLPTTAQARPGKGSSFAVPVTGELEDGGTFKGKIVNPEVAPADGEGLNMSGTLRGTARTADGETERVNQEFTAPLAVQETNQTFQAQQQSCPILNLDLGPIFLDLLGLQVDLAPVNLDVTAVPGAGNLLGNLLCGVAGLLDGFDLSGVIANVVSDLLNGLLEGLFGNALR